MQDAKDLALGHWPQILEDAGIDANFLRDVHGPCPVCGGTDRFRFDDKDGKGTYFCSKCGAGNGFKLLQLYMGYPGFKEAARHVEEYFGSGRAASRPSTYAPAVKSVTKDPEIIRAKLQKVWDFARTVKPGDPVHKYLTQTRRLPADIPSVLRYNPRGACYEKNSQGEIELVGKFPMMVAKVQGPDGRPVGIHRTFLTQDGKKAPVKEAKKLMTGLGYSGGAIRLFPATDILAVAEGIETALAVHAVTGQPCWATVSATMMETVVVPESVKLVIIYADNDKPDEKGRRAGQDAAKALSERLKAEGRRVRIVQSVSKGCDIFDVWLARLDKEEKRKAKKLSDQNRIAA